MMKYRSALPRRNPRAHKVADAGGNRWRIAATNGAGKNIYIAKGSRKTSWAWAGKESRAKLFVTKGEAGRYFQDYVKHYLRAPHFNDARLEPVAYGPTLSQVLDAKKNPRGSRDSSDSSVRSPTSTRSEVRSPTRTSTSTKADTRGNVTVTGGAGAGANTTVTLKRNPRRSFGKKGRKAAPRKAARVSGRYMIRGQVGGVYYFFNGRGFDSVGAHAAIYWSRGLAADASRAIKGMLPHKLKSLEVVPL